MKGVKRLCVFYIRAYQWLGSTKVEWIVCKECQKKLNRGVELMPTWECNR